MTASLGVPTTTTTRWVDRAAGTVSRQVFIDDAVYALEKDRIFSKTWCFLAHESELEKPGDHVTRRLNDAPVIVSRDDKGEIHVLLNSCRHRGAQVCRADSGNSRRFVCPYHGWTYDRSGNLITTSFDEHFPDGFDFTAMGLPRVPRVAVYKGLVFASWNEDVEDISAFLGDFAWYIDPFLARTPGGMQVLAPPHRWRAKANWKVGALNFVGDSQHVLTTHAGPLTLDPVRAARAGFATAAENSFQVSTEQGHGCTLTYLAPGLPEEAYRTHPQDLEPQYTEVADGQREMLTRLRVIVGTVFPNLSFIETQVGPSEKAVIMRLWQPLNGSEMEVLSWVLAEREASEIYKDNVLRKGIHNFGAAGVFEQDDIELWASATIASDNSVASLYPYSFHTALRYLDKPERDGKWPGRVFRPADTEVAQFEFMRRWSEIMEPSA